MRSSILTAVAASLAFSGAAVAQQSQPAPPQQPVRPVYPERTLPGAFRGTCESPRANPSHSVNCLGNTSSQPRYEVGEKLASAKTAYTLFPRIPFDVRRALNLSASGSYIYEPGFLYTVDPASRVVTAVTQVIIR